MNASSIYNPSDLYYTRQRNPGVDVRTYRNGESIDLRANLGDALGAVLPPPRGCYVETEDEILARAARRAGITLRGGDS